jgi:hypothetical protein
MRYGWGGVSPSVVGHGAKPPSQALYMIIGPREVDDI